MTYKNVRPMDPPERHLVEREGLCIGCHQLYGRRSGMPCANGSGTARTTEEHAERMSEAIQALMATEQERACPSVGSRYDFLYPVASFGFFAVFSPS